MSHGSLVPWMTTGPPCSQALAGIFIWKALMPIARTPKAPSGAGGLSFWLMKKRPVGVSNPGLPTATAGEVSMSSPRRWH